MGIHVKSIHSLIFRSIQFEFLLVLSLSLLLLSVAVVVTRDFGYRYRSSHTTVCSMTFVTAKGIVTAVPNKALGSADVQYQCHGNTPHS